MFPKEKTETFSPQSERRERRKKIPEEHD